MGYRQRRIKYNLSKLNQVLKTSFRLLKLLWQIDRPLILLQIILTTILAVTPFLLAYIFKLLIDQVLVGFFQLSNPASIMLLTLGLSLFTIQEITSSVLDYAARLLYAKVPISLHEKVLYKVASLDLSYIEDSNFQATLEKVRESYAWRPLNMFGNILLSYQSSAQILVAVVLIGSLNIYIILPVILLTIPEFIFQLQHSHHAWGIWQKNSPFRKKFWYLSLLLQDRSSNKELKAYDSAKWLLSELKTDQKTFYAHNRKLAFSFLTKNLTMNILQGLAYGAYLLYIILLAILKKITIGDITYYTNALVRLQNGLSNGFRYISKIFDDSLYLQSIFDLLDIEPKITTNKKYYALDLKKTPKIEFKNVSFKYPGNKNYTLRNVSFTINPGQKVAFVGPNGSGKTTLIKLIARFYDVSSGEILIDGINLQLLDLASWYRLLGILFQDFVNYELTAQNNIYLGNVTQPKNQTRIKEAAKASTIHQLIASFDKKYHQMLGKTFEDGIDLSLGQWQKVALARTFYKNPLVMMLDEPTSMLDPESEIKLMNLLINLSTNKTVIIISHRLASIKNADIIYLLEKGKITEAGSHTELLESNRRYSKSYTQQIQINT